MAIQVSKTDILEALTWTGVEDEPNWAYSGRGMYGGTCFGFTGTMEDYSYFLLGLVNWFYTQTEDIADSIQLAGFFVERVQTDNMGRSTIFYFPGIEVVDDEANAEA